MNMKTYQNIIPMRALKLGAIVLLAGAASCSDDRFTVEGDIVGASHELVVLEKADFGGRWVVLDSLRTAADGTFTLRYEASDSPQLYRLQAGNGYAYIPVDSTETIILNAKASDFAATWTLSGSRQADAISAFEKEVRQAEQADATSREFKRHLYSTYINGSAASLVSYYILTKTLADGTQLFDPADKDDLQIFSAVATAYREYRPDDPRTPLLESTVIQMRRNNNSSSGRKLVVEAEEKSMIDIVLPDEKGNTVKLSDAVGHGKPLVLMFNLMNNDITVGINRILADLREARGGDLNLFSVSFDSDAGQWRESAANVPWTTVLDHNATSSAANDYNVSSVPSFFIFDRQGNLVDATRDIQEVAALVSKHS